MTIDVVVPQIGEAVSELILSEWYKAPGERVTRGEPLFSVDADKSVVDVEAVVDGILAEVLSPDGSSVMPRDVVARIATESESPSPPPSVETGRSPATGVTARPEAGNGAAGSGHVVRGTRRAASPRARHEARARGIDLDTVSGSGVRGMVVTADLGSRSPTRDLQTVIAERMTRSKREIPHFYLRTEIVMAGASEVRTQSSAQVSYLAMTVQACARALTTVREANVRYSVSGPVPLDRTGIGIAVAVPGGILVPVVHDAESARLTDLTREIDDAVARARAEKLRASDVSDKSMIVSNLGMYDVDEFAAIIEPGDTMMIAMGSVADRVIASGGAATVRPTMIATLSVDHRAINGVPAARFLAEVKRLLEDARGLLSAGEGRA